MSETSTPKNIVLLSDGTGNSSAKLFKTNVWRLYQALDLADPKTQIAYYDDGVGTSSFKFLAAVTGVFGVGLKRNVIDIYSFCCRNYVEGDRIYGFGFSRGAFTIRVVAGLIAYVGLVKYNGNESDLAAQAEAAYRNYRKRFHTALRTESVLRWVRDLFATKLDRANLTEVDRIHFLGLWDTVDAYGGPIEEITRAIDYWFWPLSMPDRFMSAKVTRACHSLSLEDERDAFKPVIWDERYVRGPGGRLFPADYRWPTNRPAPEAAPQGGAAELPPIDQQRISQAGLPASTPISAAVIRRTGCPSSRWTGSSTAPSRWGCKSSTSSANCFASRSTRSTSSMIRVPALPATIVTGRATLRKSTTPRLTSRRFPATSSICSDWLPGERTRRPTSGMNLAMPSRCRRRARSSIRPCSIASLRAPMAMRRS